MGAQGSKGEIYGSGIGSKNGDSYLSARLEIESGILMGIKIWDRQSTIGWAEMGVPKRGFFGTPKNEPKSNVYPRVFLHDGLETGLNVRCEIQQESDGGPQVLGSQISPCAMVW